MELLPALVALAVTSGNVEAMLKYIEGVHLITRSSHDFMAHPDFERWRREAPAMQERLLRAGVPEAVFLELVSTGDDFGLYAALVPDDRERALAMRLLMRRLGNGGGPRIEFPDPEMGRRAEALAARWHRERFGGRRAIGNEMTRRLT